MLVTLHLRNAAETYENIESFLFFRELRGQRNLELFDCSYIKNTNDTQDLIKLVALYCSGTLKHLIVNRNMEPGNLLSKFKILQTVQFRASNDKIDLVLHLSMKCLTYTNHFCTKKFCNFLRVPIHNI